MVMIEHPLKNSSIIYQDFKECHLHFFLLLECAFDCYLQIELWMWNENIYRLLVLTVYSTGLLADL